jgi:hypothetical protein
MAAVCIGRPSVGTWSYVRPVYPGFREGFGIFTYLLRHVGVPVRRVLRDIICTNIMHAFTRTGLQQARQHEPAELIVCHFSSILPAHIAT